MKKCRMAYEYKDCWNKAPIAIEDEINGLDLTEKTMHYQALRYDGQKVEVGMGNKYEIVEMDIPSWSNSKRYLTDSQYEDSVDLIILYSNHPDDPRLEKLIGLSDKEIQKALRALGHKVYKIK